MAFMGIRGGRNCACNRLPESVIRREFWFVKRGFRALGIFSFLPVGLFGIVRENSLEILLLRRHGGGMRFPQAVEPLFFR